MTDMDTERITLQEYHDRISDIIRAFGQREPREGEVEAAVAKAVAAGQTNVGLNDDGSTYVEVAVW